MNLKAAYLPVKGKSMDYIDYNGKLHREQGTQDRLLSVLYGTKVGRAAVRLLIHPGISRMAGKFLDTKLSRCLVGPFIRCCRLDLSSYLRKKPEEFISYNDFFTREIDPKQRTVDQEPGHLPSPCDGKVTVYEIKEDTSFVIKNAGYTVESLLRNKALARRFEGGYAVVLRLCVTDYHRYIYPVTGEKSKNCHIPGVLHTVNPVAVETADVFKENSREYTLIKSREFGTVLQMEVGALLVGRICNYHQERTVIRGMEKGKFEFGGSTIILLLQKDRAVIRKDLLENTDKNRETQVKMGECIAGINMSIKNT